MAEPSLALQKAVYAALNGTISIPVFDQAPAETSLPYAQVGDDSWAQDDSHDDDDAQRGWTGLISIEVWDAEHAGRATVKGILSEIDDALHGAALVVNGYLCDWVRYQASGVGRVDERPLYRGFITFEVRLSQAA